MLIQPLFAKPSLGNKTNFSPSHLPQFENYPASEPFKGTIAPVDINSYPEARRYRTRLREGVKAGPNFAGHYVIVTIGCGTSCQNQWIVDANNGKVLARFLTSMGAEYRPNSTLLILNPPSQDLKKEYKEHPEAPFWTGETLYITWEKDNPILLYKEDLTRLLQEPEAQKD